MDNRKETAFIFAVDMFLTIFIGVLILFCVEDFLKSYGFYWVRIIFFFSLIIFTAFLFISLGLLLFTSNGTEETKSWIVVTQNNGQINTNAEKLCLMLV